MWKINRISFRNKLFIKLRRCWISCFRKGYNQKQKGQFRHEFIIKGLIQRPNPHILHSERSITPTQRLLWLTKHNLSRTVWIAHLAFPVTWGKVRLQILHRQRMLGVVAPDSRPRRGVVSKKWVWRVWDPKQRYSQWRWLDWFSRLGRRWHCDRRRRRGGRKWGRGQERQGQGWQQQPQE